MTRSEPSCKTTSRPSSGARTGRWGSVPPSPPDPASPSGPTPRPIEGRVDGRRDYLFAWRSHADRDRFRLEVYPNPVRGPKGSPRSAEAVVRDRAMAPVDQWRRLIRHTCADHKRETIAFGRRVESFLARLFLTTVWKNFIDPDPTLSRPPCSASRLQGAR